jgi:hypothetical protein
MVWETRTSIVVANYKVFSTGYTSNTTVIVGIGKL